MIEVAVVILMFIGVGLAMHMDVSPRSAPSPAAPEREAQTSVRPAA